MVTVANTRTKSGMQAPPAVAPGHGGGGRTVKVPRGTIQPSRKWYRDVATCMQLLCLGHKGDRASCQWTSCTTCQSIPCHEQPPRSTSQELELSTML